MMTTTVMTTSTHPLASTSKIRASQSTAENQKREPTPILPSSKSMLAKLNELQAKDRKTKPKKISFNITPTARNLDAKNLLTFPQPEEEEEEDKAEEKQDEKEKTNPVSDINIVKERLEKLKSRLNLQNIPEKIAAISNSNNKDKKSVLQRLYENSADDFSIERLAPSDREFEKRKQAKTDEDRMEEVEDSLIRRAEEFLKHKKSNALFTDDIRSGRLPIVQVDKGKGDKKPEEWEGSKGTESLCQPPPKFIDEPISVISVLRLLTALEEKLGSMGENVSVKTVLYLF